ncbi:Hpt domain protein [Planctopirus limnophila DSM 3776]|uniref:Hpt domain protein n=1 Tax=Planctopirus limnophila (strain ATCC 43296 / DSM 3776 / IFAM 1008 / Mu 290) TaxID=521674 RepID=D5SPW1_PLAL2|nr:Hpt domain-containing protein [Planctopirus limnophila]ADG68336.1 Hpt domain protein [Planctopirus limnophila DSM 3776]
MQPVRSEYASDPDYEELIADFVAVMPERISELELVLGQKAHDELKRKAHQLKGAGGGYGFPELSLLAAQVESACRENRMDDILELTAELISYLRRISV